MSTQSDTHQQLADRLEELLEVESFPPPEDFVANALINDPEVYERAAADPLAWWEEQARALDWFERAGRRRSTTRIRRSTSGSPAARSTRPTTAWTATSRPASATASRSTGAARRARSARSPTPTCTRDVQRSPTR